MKNTLAKDIDSKLLLKAFELMVTARELAGLYEQNKDICARYVHSTSGGHEAIQLATGLQLKEFDYASPYYRDDAMLLGMGVTSYELLLSILAKGSDPFSGGRTYYCHPSIKKKGFPTVPHQSSATGMQAIPATGMAHGISYLESQGLLKGNSRPVVLCSLGDGSVTEGEVAEAFQMAVLKKLPIIYLVQDNNWGISATGDEMRVMNAYEYAAGFKGLERRQVDGADFIASFECMQGAIAYARGERAPILVHATCPLLGHHTSGVRKEWYRGADMEEHIARDPLPKLELLLADFGVSQESASSIR